MRRGSWSSLPNWGCLDLGRSNEMAPLPCSSDLNGWMEIVVGYVFHGNAWQITHFAHVPHSHQVLAIAIYCLFLARGYVCFLPASVRTANDFQHDVMWISRRPKGLTEVLSCGAVSWEGSAGFMLEVYWKFCNILHKVKPVKVRKLMRLYMWDVLLSTNSLAKYNLSKVWTNLNNHFAWWTIRVLNRNAAVISDVSKRY